MSEHERCRRLLLRQQALELRDYLLKSAYDLDRYLNTVDMATDVGNAVTLAGAGVALMAGAVSLLTFGLGPLALAVKAVCVATAGKVTANSAPLIGTIIEVVKLEEMEKKWEHFKMTYFEETESIQEEVNSKITNTKQASIEKGLTPLSGTAAVVGTHFDEMKDLSSSIKYQSGVLELKRSNKEIVTALATSVAKLNTSLLANSLRELTDKSVERSKVTGGRAGDLLRELARDLENFI